MDPVEADAAPMESATFITQCSRRGNGSGQLHMRDVACMKATVANLSANGEMAGKVSEDENSFRSRSCGLSIIALLLTRSSRPEAPACSRKARLCHEIMGLMLPLCVPGGKRLLVFVRSDEAGASCAQGAGRVHEGMGSASRRGWRRFSGGWRALPCSSRGSPSGVPRTGRLRGLARVPVGRWAWSRQLTTSTPRSSHCANGDVTRVVVRGHGHARCRVMCAFVGFAPLLRSR